MNWGHKIIVVYVVFVAGMLFMAFKSSKQNIELVTEDYYAKELVYQQRIDEISRTALLSAPVNIQMDSHALTIQFPRDFASKKIAGEVSLYCPSDERKDIKQPFSITDSTIRMALPDNYHGLHYVKIAWNVDGVNYYFEQKLII